MKTSFNFHDLLEIRLDAPDGPFRDYFELEFNHGAPRPIDDNAGHRAPTLNVSLGEPATGGAIWALGKGLFFNEDTGEVLVSRNRDTSFFQPGDIYASLTNVLEAEDRDLSARFKPAVLLNRDFHSRVRDVYWRFVRWQPRNESWTNAATFVSQLLDPSIFRLFLRTGHLLLHAAALEKDGTGILIFGPQNIGKTTVTIQLSRRGWKMLGDDTCLMDGGARLLSNAKPLKLERELLASSPAARRFAAAGEGALDATLRRLRSRLRPAGASPEVKVPPSALGIETIPSADARMAFFLQRAVNLPGRDGAHVQPLSADEATTLCEQHIAAEYDGNKYLDRDIRQNLALHFRTAGSLSMVTPKVSAVIRAAFANIDSYLITMSQPDVDAAKAIEAAVRREL